MNDSARPGACFSERISLLEVSLCILQGLECQSKSPGIGPFWEKLFFHFSQLATLFHYRAKIIPSFGILFHREETTLFTIGFDSEISSHRLIRGFDFSSTSVPFARVSARSKVRRSYFAITPESKRSKNRGNVSKRCLARGLHLSHLGIARAADPD